LHRRKELTATCHILQQCEHVFAVSHLFDKDIQILNHCRQIS